MVILHTVSIMSAQVPFV